MDCHTAWQSADHRIVICDDPDSVWQNVQNLYAVSYTHLDVYKRQAGYLPNEEVWNVDATYENQNLAKIELNKEVENQPTETRLSLIHISAERQTHEGTGRTNVHDYCNRSSWHLVSRKNTQTGSKRVSASAGIL